jgi:uncharacterized protein with PQ loop repeat
MHSKKFQRKLRKLKKQGMQYKAIKEVEDEFGAYFPEKKHRKVSNIMLVISVICIIAYTIASLLLQYFTSVEVSSTLTTCWFSFFGCELFLLAGIKTSKVIKGDSYYSDDYDDESHG